MRRIAALFVLLLATPAGAQPKPGAPRVPAIRTDLVTSEMLSLFYFAEVVAGTPNRSPYLRAVYEQHRAEAPEAPALLEHALRLAPRSLVFYPNATERPFGRGLSRELDDVLEALALRAATLEDFGNAALGLLPIEGWVDLMAALRQLAPIHQRYVWEARKAGLEKARAALVSLWARAGTEALLARAARFYGSRWPDGLPVTVALVPVPSMGAGQAYAHSRGPIEVVEVLDDDDLDRRYAVLVHELAHSLYEEQPLETKLAQERSFTASGTPIARATYATINEALATVLGNGLAAEQAGRPTKGSWYNDPVIDGLARELYPLTKRYLDEGRAMDGAFIDAAIAGMGRRFPNADRAPRFLFSALHLITAAGLDPRAIELQLGTVVRFKTLQVSSPHTHPKTLEHYAKMKDTATLIVVPHAASLTAYPFYAQAKGLLDAVAAMKGAAYLAVRDGERMTTVLVVDGDPTAALKRMLSLSAFELGRAVPLE